MDLFRKSLKLGYKFNYVLYCSELGRKMVFAIQKANLVDIQSSRFWWYSFVFEKNAESSSFKGYFQGQKGPIWTFVMANISETVHAVTNVCMKHIYKVIYDLSFSLPCDLWHWITFKSQIKVTYHSHTIQGVVSHKWCIIWSKFVWYTYSKSYMAFQFTL